MWSCNCTLVPNCTALSLINRDFSLFWSLHMEQVYVLEPVKNVDWFSVSTRGRVPGTDVQKTQWDGG